jgi:hypothetical protein
MGVINQKGLKYKGYKVEINGDGDTLTISNDFGTTLATIDSDGLHAYKLPYVLKTADYTITTDDSTVLFSGSTALTGTLPSTATEGQVWTIVNGGLTTVTVTASAGTIYGAANAGRLVTYAQGNSYTVQCIADNTYVVIGMSSGSSFI